MMVQERMDMLRNWRKSLGLSASEAGALIAVSGVQWSRIENGTRAVAPEKVLEVEKATGISRHTLRPDIFGPTPGRAA